MAAVPIASVALATLTQFTTDASTHFTTLTLLQAAVPIANTGYAYPSAGPGFSFNMGFQSGQTKSDGTDYYVRY
jgi:hypothetical protein